MKTKSKKSEKSKISSAFLISQFYGFEGMDPLEVIKEDRTRAGTLRKGNDYIDDQLPPIEEQVALIRTYIEGVHKDKPHPLMLYHEGQPGGGHKKKRRKTGELPVSLHIIGTPKSIAEALLIKTACCILEEEGYKNVTVHINSVGNKDSFNHFMKEATNHYRKYLNELNSTCRQLFKDGIHSLIACGTGVPSEIRAEAPSPLSFLDEDSRRHFKEVVEFLESQKIPYEINKEILGDPHYSTDTIFSILDTESGKILATGSRYNSLAKKLGQRREVPAVALSMVLSKNKKVTAKAPDIKNSKFYFIQIGFDAKLKSLGVIEELRKAQIGVYQSLSRDRLSTQLQVAEKLQFPYVIIMGQKEAIENSVVVRDVSTHSQETVPLSELNAYLKKIK